MKIYIFLIYLTPLFVFSQQDCRLIKKDKEQFINKKTASYELVGFGDIPIDTTRNYKHDNPFTIENNCLLFKITHMGCNCSFEMFWDGNVKTDKEGQTIIIDLKFILSYTDPCKRLNHTNLKYDLTEIVKNQEGKKVFINFVGYDKLIEVK